MSIKNSDRDNMFIGEFPVGFHTELAFRKTQYIKKVIAYYIIIGDLGKSPWLLKKTPKSSAFLCGELPPCMRLNGFLGKNVMICRAGKIPAYLEQAALQLEEEKKLAKQAALDSKVQENLKRGRVALSWGEKNLQLMNHGFGVREDIRTGSIWYVEGNELVRQNSDEDIELIIASLGD